MVTAFKSQTRVAGICSVFISVIALLGWHSTEYAHSAAATPQQTTTKDTRDNTAELMKSIFEKIIEAQGGRGPISNLKDSKLSADYKVLPQEQNIMAVSYMKLPDKLRIDMDRIGTRVFDGKSGWAPDPRTGSIQDMSESALEDFKNSAWAAQGMLNPKILNISPTLEGRSPIDGKDYILISYPDWCGFDTVYVHVDPDTFLPSIFTYLKSGIKIQVIHSDYRDVDGLMLPFSISTNIDGKKSIAIFVREWKLNSGLNDSLFNRESVEVQKGSLPQIDLTGFTDRNHEPQLMHRVEPIYPTLARRAQVSGDVILRITIDAEGKVQFVQAVEGHPLLKDAAVKAVKQWRYHPTIQDGKPIQVTKMVTISFMASN